MLRTYGWPCPIPPSTPQRVHRLWQFAGKLVGEGQVTERGERVGVIGPQRPHLRIAHPLEEFDRLRKPAGLPIVHGQVVERAESIGLIGAERGFPQLGWQSRTLSPVRILHRRHRYRQQSCAFGLQKRLLGEVRLDLVGVNRSPRDRAVRGSWD